MNPHLQKREGEFKELPSVMEGKKITTTPQGRGI